MDTFERGTQIAYIPSHAEGNIHHPDVEYGFVTSVDGKFAWCRYYAKNQIGNLRTIANSKKTPIANLVKCEMVSARILNGLISQVELEEEKRFSTHDNGVASMYALPQEKIHVKKPKP